MSLKVDVSHRNKEEKPEFPKLMISSLGQILLVLGINDEDENLRKVVMLYDNNYPIGGNGYTKNFYSDLKDYHGEITLSNS